MKHKKFLVLGFIAIVALSAVVMSLTLQWERQVLTCTDTDGLNVNVTGTASGLTLMQTNYSFTDFCVNNNTVGEYQCLTSGNTTLLRFWHEDCNCVNGHCA